MSRRDDEGRGNELADWLAGLNESPADDAAATPPPVPTDPPTVPTDPPTVPTDPPTVPTPNGELFDLPGGEATPAAAGAPATAPAGDAGRGERSRGSRRLWALAAVPWLAGALLALAAWGGLGAAGGSDATDRAATSPAIDHPDRGPADGASPRLPDADDAVAGELAAAAEAAVATVGARRLADAGDGGVHIGHARATGATPLDDDVVVTVAALMRRAVDGRWGEPQPARFAVVLDGDARLREPPWPLPSGDLLADDLEPAQLDPVDLEAAEGLVDAAGDALARAGYDTPEVQALHRVGGDRAVRVEAVAQPPGATERAAVAVWLTPDADRVLGQRAAPEGAETEEPKR